MFKHKEERWHCFTVGVVILNLFFVIICCIGCWSKNKTLDIVSSIHDIIVLHHKVTLWSTISVIKIMDSTPEKYFFIPRTNKSITTPFGRGSVLVYSNDENTVSIKLIGLGKQECFWLGHHFAHEKMSNDTDVFVNNRNVVNSIPLCDDGYGNVLSFFIKKMRQS